MEKLRILWMNWRDIQNPKAGGAERYIYEVSKELVNLGHEVHWLAPRFNGSQEEAELDGIFILRVGGEKSIFLKAWREYSRMADYFDVVIECINTIPFLTPLYVRQKSISLVFQLTGEIYRYVLPVPACYLGMMTEKLTYALIYRPRTAIVLSKSTKNELMEIGFDPLRIIVAEPGVDSKYLVPGRKSPFPSILYLNRVVPYKNVHHVLLAFKVVHDHIPDSRLVIAGCRGSSYEHTLLVLADRLGVKDHVSFVPFVAGDAKRKLLQEAWVHVLPSAKEGYGISVLEAASCGTPSIGYDVAGVRDSIIDRKTGILVKYGDLNGLASCILSVLSDENLRIDLSNNAREHAKECTWEVTAKNVLKAFQKRSAS